MRVSENGRKGSEPWVKPVDAERRTQPRGQTRAAGEHTRADETESAVTVLWRGSPAVRIAFCTGARSVLQPPSLGRARQRRQRAVRAGGRTGSFSADSTALLPALPSQLTVIHLRLRTNGYAALGTLRGWFQLDQLGSGKLFIEARHPPFIVIRFYGGFVCVNYTEPAKTEHLFTELRREFPKLTTEPQ
jgi:hypothetical protein